MNKTDLKILESLRPCADGLAWAKTQDSLCGVYDNCERADWMIWLLCKTGNLTQEQAVEIAIVCAKHVHHDKKWNRWADRWLSGEDRTRDSAVSAARAGERRWQADQIREIVKNPWGKK
jgi:hypothetical protein